MKMYELLKIFNINSFDNRKIRGITFDINKITPNKVFILFKKEDIININLIKNKKPLLIITPFIIKDTLFIKDLKRYLTKIFLTYYKVDLSKLHLIAITGTEMKSSLAKLIFDILSLNNEKVLLISSSFKGENIINSSLTTPQGNELAKIFKYALNNNYKKVIFEASSIAIDTFRLEAICPNEIILTNLKEDHLDYHKTIDNYYKCKASYINKSLKIYAKEDDFNKLNINREYIKIENIINKNIKNKFKNFNDLQLNITPYILNYCISNKIKIDFNLLKYPEGRVDIINHNPLIMIDYAHSSNAFNVVSNYFSSLIKGKKIIVFGAGGNRDTLKREKYKQIAKSYFDKIIISEDNSRDENLDNIIKDLIDYNDKKFIVIKNRKNAIKYAYSLLKKDDGLLIIGKGIENYIIKNNKKYKHNDKDYILKLLKKH